MTDDKTPDEATQDAQPQAPAEERPQIEKIVWAETVEQYRCSACGYTEPRTDEGKATVQAHIDLMHPAEGATFTPIPADYVPEPVMGTHEMKPATETKRGPRAAKRRADR